MFKPTKNRHLIVGECELSDVFPSSISFEYFL